MTPGAIGPLDRRLVIAIAYGALATLAIALLVVLRWPSTIPGRAGPAWEDAMAALIGGELSERYPGRPILLVPVLPLPGGPAAPAATRGVSGLVVSSSQVTHLHLLAAWLEPASPDRPYQVEIELRNGGVLGAGMLRVTGRGRWGFDGDLPVALAEVRAVRIVRDGRPVLRGEAPAP